MTVVITFLALMAAMIIPNLVAIKRSRDLQDVEAALARLPMEAKNEARRARVPVTLRVDGNTVVLERLAVPEEGTAAAIGTDAASAEPEEFRRVRLGRDIEVETVLTADESLDVAAWQWTVYPDGSADASGALLFSVAGTQKALALTGDGGSRWVTGEVGADIAESVSVASERWAAGELEQRGQGE